MDIEKERAERLALFGKRFAEPLDVVPAILNSVERGAICRLWFMPNQSRFVFAGVLGGVAKVVLGNGQVSGFMLDTLVVVVEPASAGFEPLTPMIEAFERELHRAAWRGRDV